MAVFDWVYAGSGQPIKYNQATIMTQGSIRTYVRSGEITAIQPSGTTAYLDRLNDRYLYDPSGWNS